MKGIANIERRIVRHDLFWNFKNIAVVIVKAYNKD